MAEGKIQLHDKGKSPMALRCPHCGAKLALTPDSYSCGQCGAHWPIAGGIPRFFEAGDYYWGEVDREQARGFLEEARRGSWVKAVRERFGSGQLFNSILDLSRAAWLVLLDLGRDAIALDIGSGYGAITHSLACSLGTIYSVEAVPERIEFTQTRLQQEGIDNVHLIQASAIRLPFFEKSFDLVVANGILEWIGEWDLEGNARDAQLRFLSAVQRMLKDDGVLVIGIENRIGYYLFLGAQDHSGLPYTSLLPRRLATFYLQHTSYRSERMNPNKEYRTYTYSVAGYRKLLREAGFESASFYWADPTYNSPYELTPLSAPWLMTERQLAKFDCPGPSRRSTWVLRLKRAAARMGLLNPFVGDFVILASKSSSRITTVREWLAEHVQRESRDLVDHAVRPEKIVLSCSTAPFYVKRVLRFCEPKEADQRLIAKAEVRVRAPRSELQTEVENLKLVREHLEAAHVTSLAVPKPIDFLPQGNTLYYLESRARGRAFYSDVHRPGYFSNLQKAKRDFIHLTRAAIELARVLQRLPGVHRIDSCWYDLPEEVRSSPEICDRLEHARYFSDSSVGLRPAWIQHGDFVDENIFVDRQTGRVEIIDWSHLAGGLPPLYDLFSMFVGSRYLDVARRGATRMDDEECRVASFEDLFFSDSRFGAIAGELLGESCQQLQINPDWIPALLIEFLIIRTNYYRSRGLVSSTETRIHAMLLRIFGQQGRLVFGRFPVNGVSLLS